MTQRCSIGSRLWLPAGSENKRRESTYQPNKQNLGENGRARELPPVFGIHVAFLRKSQTLSLERLP